MKKPEMETPMKSWTKNLLLQHTLIAALGLLLAGRVTAQPFTTLHSFNGSDGADPVAGLILSGNTLYGTTAGILLGSGTGTVFAVNTDGTAFTKLHGFTPIIGPAYTNSDGSCPTAGLILSGDTLYGTAAYGGSLGYGTVFKVNTNGTGFTNLHDFTFDSDGAYPQASLILSGNTLYGTASGGGSSGNGTVFAINTNGTGFKTLHSFTATPSSYPYTNSDGAGPSGLLTLLGNTLFGTASQGGTSGNGTIFKVNTNGTAFANLHSFSASFPDCTNVVFGGVAYTNSEGTGPNGLILLGDTLYGTAEGGGTSGYGTVFKVNTDGTGFMNLHSFTPLCIGPPVPLTNSDGALSVGALVLLGNTLFGTASQGGTSGYGTVFAVNTDGTSFTILHSFTAQSLSDTNSDGANPQGGLILSGNTLYGTAQTGGGSGYGTVFSISLPVPQLTIIRSGANVILTWPTNYAGFDYTRYTLQSTTNLVSPVWTTNLPAPVVVNGQYTVTNPISGSQQFFRLSQ